MEKKLEIGRVSILCKLDKERKIVHMMDLDALVSLTNGLGREFCKEVLSKLGVEDCISQVKFVSYHTDFEFTRFFPEDGGFEFLTIESDLIDKDFAKEGFYLYGEK